MLHEFSLPLHCGLSQVYWLVDNIRDDILRWFAKDAEIGGLLGFQDGYKTGSVDELKFRRKTYSDIYVEGFQYGVAAIVIYEEPK